jgi:hypothetical protein
MATGLLKPIEPFDFESVNKTVEKCLKHVRIFVKTQISSVISLFV